MIKQTNINIFLFQADGMFGPAKYKGIVHCFKSSISAEGSRVLSRGLSSTVIRAFPTNAATFAVVSWTMDNFGSKTIEEETYNFWNDMQTSRDKLFYASRIPLDYINDNYKGQVHYSFSLLPTVEASSPSRSTNNVSKEQIDILKSFIHESQINDVCCVLCGISIPNTSTQTYHSKICSRCKS